MKKVSTRIIEALKEFTTKLESGKPIQATRIERIETPDGPMHLRRKVTLKGK